MSTKMAVRRSNRLRELHAAKSKKESEDNEAEISHEEAEISPEEAEISSEEAEISSEEAEISSEISSEEIDEKSSELTDAKAGSATWRCEHCGRHYKQRGNMTTHIQEELAEALARVPSIQHLPSFDELVSKFTVVKVKPGETIVRAGEKGDAFYIVKSGSFAELSAFERVAEGSKGPVINLSREEMQMDSEPHGEEDVEEDGVEEKEAAEAAVQGAEEKAAGEDMILYEFTESGEYFGDQSLLYGRNSDFDVVATSEAATLWRLDADEFAKVVGSRDGTLLKELFNLIKGSFLFEGLPDDQILRVVDSLQRSEYTKGENADLEAGAPGGARIGVVYSGEGVKTLPENDDGVKCTLKLQPGDIVDTTERAMINISSDDPLVIYSLTGAALERFLSPLRNVRADEKDERSVEEEKSFHEERSFKSTNMNTNVPLGFNITIEAHKKKEESKVTVTGRIEKVIRDKEIKEAFKLNSDKGVKAAVKAYSGRKPRNVWMYKNANVAKEELYSRYQWREVTVVQEPVRAWVSSVTSKPVIVKTSMLENSYTKSATFFADMDHEVTHSVSRGETTIKELKLGSETKFKVGLFGTGTETTAKFDFTRTNGTQFTETMTEKRTSKDGVSVDLDPGESVQCSMSASLGVLTVRVRYRAYLTGRIVTWYQKKLNGHFCWAYSVGSILAKSNIPRYIYDEEEIKVTFYSNSSVKLGDRLNGA